MCPEEVGFNRLEFLLSSIITFASTFSGFMLTAVTVIIGYAKTDIMQTIYNSNAKRELTFRYVESITCGILLIVLCAIVGEITPQSGLVSRKFLSVGVGVILYYLCSLFTTGYYLVSVISLSANLGKQRDNNPYRPASGFNIAKKRS